MAKETQEYKNLDSRQKNCLALIESLGIYELRAVARVFGDNSPTTLKRNDHIKIIMDKIISGEELRPLPMRQGRPFKELSNIQGILKELSTIAGKDYMPKNVSSISEKLPEKVVVFHQADDSVLKQKLMPVDARGVLREKSEKEFYFQNLENGTLVLVRKNLDSRLQANDYVTGSAILMNDEGDYSLDLIKTINFRSDKLYYDSFISPQKVSPTEKIDLAGHEVLLGGRHVVKIARFSDEESKIKDIVKKLNEQNIATLALIPNVMSEDEEAIKNLGFNAPFMLRYEAQAQDSYEIIAAFIDCILRLQSQGLKLAIFVEDIMTLANIVDAKNETTVGHSEKTIDTIKRLMLLPKADQSGANTTLFVTQSETDLFDQTYVAYVYKISNKFSL